MELVRCGGEGEERGKYFWEEGFIWNLGWVVE